jgi:ribulose-bisphosphate carboxylase small chain
MMTNNGNIVTQGQFSFLPPLTDVQITAQIKYALGKGWALGIEYTDDPHPRNTYWEMFGNPMFDLKDPAGILLEINNARKTFPNHYIRVTACVRKPMAVPCATPSTPTRPTSPKASAINQVIRLM